MHNQKYLIRLFRILLAREQSYIRILDRRGWAATCDTYRYLIRTQQRRAEIGRQLNLGLL